MLSAYCVPEIIHHQNIYHMPHLQSLGHSEEIVFRARREASIRIGTDVVAKYKSSRLYSQGTIARMCGPNIEGEAYHISFDDGYFLAHSMLTTPTRSLQKDASSDTPDRGYR